MSNEKKHPNKTLLRALVMSVAATLPVTALIAADSSPKKLMHERHEHYEELGEAFKTVRDQTRAGTPDMVKVKKAAQVINEASIDQGRWFPAGTGPEAGKTRAKAEIWQRPGDFTAAQKVFSDAAPKLLEAANTGDAGKVREQFSGVGKACKNCHDTFRTPED